MKLFEILEFIASICIFLCFMYVLWFYVVAVKFAEKQYFGY